ncbi:Crp/Fnr family transcriptional regulator [Candidatus Thioglobus sp.]|nr:Crp/Fnr family transcriptional regulator [Candidatus Thioglobus sp.]
MTPTQKYIDKYHGYLLSLPIFKNLTQEALGGLFAALKIKYFQKGEVASFSSTEHSRLYINFDGLFKLTKIDQRGNELVLKIVGLKDVVSPMHFSPHYYVTAVFVKKTTLFYFPQEAIAKAMAEHHQFSLNIVQYLAESVQSLMLSAEVLQLKTAKEKVGWYLVHSKANGTFELPYSKSLTAAYLGMQPESFSRALSELKKDGIVLNNKKILLDNGDELCTYCDPVTGSNCAFFKTDHCLHT